MRPFWMKHGTKIWGPVGEDGWGVQWERMWGGEGGQPRPLRPSEFPAQDLLDFPQRVPTLGQAAGCLNRPWPSGLPAGSAWDCQPSSGPEEPAQGARVCPVPTPSPQPSVPSWVTELAGNPTPAKPTAET